jgi:hypothetical protein
MHPPPVFGALLLQRLDEGQAVVKTCGQSLVIGKAGAPALLSGNPGRQAFERIVHALDAVLGVKINRLGKRTTVGPVWVELQHNKQNRSSLRMGWNGPSTAHERMAFLRCFQPFDTMPMEWL